MGSCRLRAIAFKDEMMQRFPKIPVNIIVNEVHCYIEMKLDHHWQTYCLGGGSSFLNQKVVECTMTECCQFKFFAKNDITKDNVEHNPPFQVTRV